MEEFEIKITPKERKEYIHQLLKLDGMSHIKEDPLKAYSTISLTSTPKEQEELIKKRQRILVDEVLAKVGIIAYNPATSIFSPDNSLEAKPEQVYNHDTEKILEARFFTGHMILPSTGAGIELEKAYRFNRIAVILMDKKIRQSRMQPRRAIYLQYDNFEKEKEAFVEVFEMLKQFEPGMGLRGTTPILLGFDQKGNVVDLEQEVYKTFPKLKYKFDSDASRIELNIENSEVFYENN